MSLIDSLLKLESRLKCELCQGLLCEARTLKECGHRFCRRCVYEKIGKERQCPTCRLPAIVKNLRPDPMHDTLVACVRKLGTLLTDVHTVDSNALYRSLPSRSNESMASSETQTPSLLRQRRVSSDKACCTGHPSSAGTETQTPSLLKQVSYDELRNESSQSNTRTAGSETQTPSILYQRRSSATKTSLRRASNDNNQIPSESNATGTQPRQRASSEGTESPSVLKRSISSEILLRDEPARLLPHCGPPLLQGFMPEVELSRREAVYEDTHVPSLLRNDDLKSQASDDSQDMVLTNPDVSDNELFDDKISESSDMSLSNPGSLLLKEPDDELLEDELPMKRNWSDATSAKKKRRMDPDDRIDPVEVICGLSSQGSDIMQALCDSKDDLPHDELPPKQMDVPSSPEDILAAMFESKDDLPEDELPHKEPVQRQSSPKDLLTAMLESKDDLPEDELPRKEPEQRQSSPEDLLTAMFESKDDLPDDEIPPEQRRKKDTHQSKTFEKIPSQVIQEPATAPNPCQEPKPHPPQEVWKCGHCYFMNVSRSDSCNLCKQARGTTPQTAIPQSVPMQASLAVMGSIVPTSQWQQDQYASLDVQRTEDVHVIFTGVNRDEAQERVATAFASGLTIHYDEADKYTEGVTHVVTHRNEDGLCGRTIKYLGGILNGAWIVDVSWLTDSSKAKRWLPEQRYEVLGDTVTGVTHGPRRGRMRKETKKGPLFGGIKFSFFDKTHSMRSELMKLCQAGGAQLLQRRPPADKSGAWRDLELDRSTINPQYPVIIIKDAKQLEKKSAKGLQLYQVRELNWLLDRISKCSLAT
ncbi:hypothetical protein BJV82DRAFT_599116 [Fennellomyces sp. T-0311]|nr:hypothetical protein BJV82DRAFT_599116 [Fennellomyces sp. T-0311]